MNRERAKELLQIIQAYAEGKEIQVKGSQDWLPAGAPNFDDVMEYRIKPEPFECWVSVRDGKVYDVAEKPYKTANPLGRTIHMREVE